MPVEIHAGGDAPPSVSSDAKDSGLEGRAVSALWLEYCAKLAWLVAGCSAMAIAFNVFLRPNELAAGGVVGLSLVIGRVLHCEPAVAQWSMNGVALLLGWKILGRDFALRTVAGGALLPLFVWLTRELPALTADRMLAAIAGGALMGVGLGTVFRSQGSVGGFSIIARIWQHFGIVTLERGILILDGIVLLAGVISFKPEPALYALIAAVVTNRLMGVTLTGFTSAHIAWIISDRHETIAAVVLTKLDRGLTRIGGTGGYSGVPRQLLMIVLHSRDVHRLKQLVREIDPDAFMILSPSSEIFGRGFRPHR